MTKTARRNKQKNNFTQKNKKCKGSKNDCKYKSCKSKMYKSIYGGRYITNMFI
jgi:hypothetical protein